jgi:histidinol-phosphate/aromatic aminotransferase/cobyric acid decarboxylase-like protein
MSGERPAIPARVHGGPDRDELAGLGLDAAALLDFSVNVNPYGAAPAVLAAVRSARLDVYPDDGATLARQSLAAAWGVPAEAIAVGNGAAELLWTSVGLLCPPGETLLVVEPTFCEPALAAAAKGARVVPVRAAAADDFAIDPAAVISAARQARAAAVYLCNPQNPTGRVLPSRTVADLATALAPAALLLDEAFLAVSTHFADARVVLPANVVRVRSFTKEHALPGLRLGALLAPPAFVRLLHAARPAWTVSAPAQAAITAIAADDVHQGFVAGIRERWLADTRALSAELTAIGLMPLPTDTVYLLCPVGDGARVRRRLLREHQVLVRDAASFGLPALVRLGGRPAADRQRLISALAAVLER